MATVAAAPCLALAVAAGGHRRRSVPPRKSANIAPPGSPAPRGFCEGMPGFHLRLDLDSNSSLSYTAVARVENPPIMPSLMTPAGPLDLYTLLLRNRIVFIGQFINSMVAQRVISQLLTLTAIDEHADIMIYINCPGGSIYSTLAIYDCMSWIKPRVGTVCFGSATSQGTFILAGGEKGMRYAMPNARIMLHHPQSGSAGHVEDVRRQANEAVHSRYKINKMFAAFTGQPVEKVLQYSERDRFMSAAEAMDFGLIDGLLQTEY